MYKKFTVMLGLSLVCVISFATDFTGATIVYPDKQSDWGEDAVRELRYYLESAVGKEFQALPESRFMRGTSIHVGDTAASLKELGTPDNLEKQEWRIKDVGDTLFITGGSPTGVLYGVYDFLNRQGIYSIAPGCDAIPKIEKLEVKNLDVKAKPAFSAHRIWPGLYTQLLLHNASSAAERKYLDSFLRGNYLMARNADHESPYRISSTGPECHSFYSYVPTEKYAETHPEYYSMNESGLREWSERSQLCLSNPEVRQIVSEQLLARIASDRAENSAVYPVLYDFSQNDAENFCRCEKCQVLVKKYGSDTGIILDMVNELADSIAKKYPDVFIQTFAYINTEAPLETIRPAKNVVIKYCDLFNSSNCFLPLRKQPERAALVKKWREQCPNVYVWDYWNMANEAKTPGMIVDAIIDDIRFFRENGVNGLFLEAEVGCHRPQSFIWLQYFLAGQLIKNPGSDAEELIGIFIRNYYGKAAPEMCKYFNFLRVAVRENPSRFSEGMLDTDFLKQASVMLEEVLKTVENDPAVRTRVLYEKNVVDYAFINKLETELVKDVDRESVIKQYGENMIFAINNNPLMSKAAKEKYLKINGDEIATFNFKYPLPTELAKYPSQNILRAAYPQFVPYLGAQIVHDAESEMPESFAWLPANPTDHKLPFCLGLWDSESKRGSSYKIDPTPEDENYHWYKLGRNRLGRETILWATHTWQMVIKLNGFYVNDEGIPEKDNPNIYDVWVNVRFAGSKYIPGSKSKDCVYIDKVVLARPESVNNFAGETFGELPQELANVPKEKIIRIGIEYLRGQVVADADSPMGTVSALTKEDKQVQADKIFSGVWSPKFEGDARNTCSRFLEVAADEKYYWHKIGTGEISRDAYIYLADWTIGFNLSDFWREGSSNRYEFWVSMKTQGPYFVKDSKRPYGIYVDRAILVEN